ncbi:MAG: helix-turn-helix domain-containing protein [Rubellimicrobium sp.]|nr:helix-turn-helix domain-containing protein [Rubellimicrobium sp.]
MMTIGKLGRAAGVKVPTIRYYEDIGLLPEAERSAGNQRLYPDSMLSRLCFIRHARELGFPLDAIRDLLRLAAHPDQPCEAADQIAGEQLAAVRARIGQLKALEGELARMVASGAHGTVGECRVIEVLGNHALCARDHGAGAGVFA